jgi:hypothetical protein
VLHHGKLDREQKTPRIMVTRGEFFQAFVAMVSTIFSESSRF